MTQFNLLPDIKMEYLRAERIRRIVISVSVILSVASLLLVGFLFSLTRLQKISINSLATDISKQGGLMSNQTNLNDILTIQNQINTLTTLHQQEPAVANLAGYLNELIPVKANISSLTADFNANTIVLTGNADSLATINQLVDSLKFATYSVQGSAGTKNAFSSVVLSSFGITSQGASYTINFNFDPTLFNITDKVKLIVPSKVTTRSQLDQPTILFKPNPVITNIKAG